MTFVRKDKQALLELVNNIEHAYSSPQAFASANSNKITLPGRLVRLTAETLSQTYEREILDSLSGAEVELMLASLLTSMEAMNKSLASVVGALPQIAPSGMVEKLKQQSGELEAMKSERDRLFDATDSLLKSDQDLLARKEELDLLRRRHEDLLTARDELSKVDLDQLRAEVTSLETQLGPERHELRRLQEQASQMKEELSSIRSAMAEAQTQLSDHEANAKETFGSLLGVSESLIVALTPHLSQCENSIREVAARLVERTTEGTRLKKELEERVPELRAAFDETALMAKALESYAASDDLVARSIPTVLNVAKEKLRRVREQLKEVDVDLKDALARHQQARYATEAARSEAGSS